MSTVVHDGKTYYQLDQTVSGTTVELHTGDPSYVDTSAGSSSTGYSVSIDGNAITGVDVTSGGSGYTASSISYQTGTATIYNSPCEGMTLEPGHIFLLPDNRYAIVTKKFLIEPGKSVTDYRMSYVVISTEDRSMPEPVVSENAPNGEQVNEPWRMVRRSDGYTQMTQVIPSAPMVEWTVPATSTSALPAVTSGYVTTTAVANSSGS